MGPANPDLRKVPAKRGAGRVLVIDDDRDFADALRDLLESRGYAVETAPGARRALKAQKAFEPDVALVDIQLEGASGLDLIAALKKRRRSLVCIIVTAHAEIDTAVEALRGGADDYLRKPLSPTELFTALERGFAKLDLLREKQAAEDALRTSEARLAGILDIAAEAVISIDRNERIRLFNKGAEAIFGYSSEEIIGQPLEGLIPARFRDAHHKHINGFARSSKVSRLMNRRGAISGLRKDGSEFPAEATISKLELGGETIFTVMLRDVTKRKRVEEALRIARYQAEDANRAKSTFLAMMSHELRTPLNAIIGFSEIIENQTFGPAGSAQYRDYAKDINESAQHLLALINDILDLSKVESGMQELHEEDIEVPDVVGSVRRVIKNRAGKGGVALEFDIPDELPALHADERSLKQILINLLSNAIKFTPDGGKVILRVWCRKDSGHVFQIVDSGIGIALTDIPKALAPFQQLDSKLERQYEGTGLGLPLTKRLIEIHGGYLDLQSEVGVGTTVTVRFPSERIVPFLDEPVSLGVEHRTAS